MRIGNTETTRKITPPPNYGARNVQLRMFMLVALLFGVIFAISEAQKPERWKWLWAFEQRAAEDGSDINPKLEIKGPEQRHSDEIVIGGNPTSPKTTSETEEPPVETHLTPEDRAWQAAWKEIEVSLESADRRWLFDVMQLARETPQPTAPGVDAPTIAEPLEVSSFENLKELWRVYLQRSRAALKDLAEAEEREAWAKVLDQLEQRWQTELQPALQAASANEFTNATHRAVLEKLQTLLDSLLLGKIQDDSPWRASEREIWFRLLGQLQAQTQDELIAKSTGLLSYAQLFKQSKSYRGKLVTVRGRAEAVYAVPSPKNNYGINEYWVFWLYPEGGPSSPLVVYSLRKPAEFPSMNAEDVGKQRMPTLEDVEFTGYYFKRYAYSGQGGIYVAPTICAAEPLWLKSEDTPRLNLPSPLQAISVVLGLIAFAAGLAGWVYYQYRPGNRQRVLEERLPFTPREEGD